MNNITFEVFKEKFNTTFVDKYSNPVEFFMDELGSIRNPMNAELKYDNTEDLSDSYKYTNEKYTKVFYFPEFDIYIEFKGWYKSYDGSGWYVDFKEVKPITKTVVKYE